MVPHRRRRWIWIGRVVATLSVAGIVSLLFAVGLGTAGQLGSAAAAVVALVALLAPYLLPPSQSEPAGTPQLGQLVSGTRVLANLSQISDVVGSIRVGPVPVGQVPPSTAAGETTHRTASGIPAGQGESQIVKDSTVSGSVIQIRGVSGNVDIGR